MKMVYFAKSKAIIDEALMNQNYIFFTKIKALI